MKKIAILCAAFAMAALGLSSCQKEENISNKIIIATFEQAVNGKVSLDADLQMFWMNDYNSSMIGIATFADNGGMDQLSSYYPTSISDDGKIAVLEYSDYREPFTAGTTGPFYAFTEAIGWNSVTMNEDGSLQMSVFSSYRTSTTSYIMPMVARSDDLGTLNFKHLCGVLKVTVNLPDGCTEGIDSVKYYSTASDYNEGCLESCDVTFDAHGNITLSNLQCWDATCHDVFVPGNGFFYCSMCPGDIHNLQFVVKTDEGSVYVKTMSPTAAIHIERAGITTLELNLTDADRVVSDGDSK